MSCEATRDRLEEYRRGELAPAAAGAVEAHLAACPACRALRAADDALVAMLRALPRTPAPPRLAAELRALGRRPRGPAAWLGRPWVAAALAATLVAAVLAPFVRLGPERPADLVEALIQSGVAEHRRILLELEAVPADVQDPDLLFARIGSVAQVPVPKVFAGVGELRLLVARPTLLASRKSAAAALRYPTSAVTTYFVLPGKDLPMPTDGRVQIDQYRPYMKQVNGFNVVYWKQADLAYLMVSGLDREGCQKLFLKMRRAL